jgi:putative transposase
MTAQLVTDALVMAIWRRGRPDALEHWMLSDCY